MKNITLEDGNTTKTSQRPARQFIMDSTIPLPLQYLHHCPMSPSITLLSHQCLHPLHYYISILIPLFHQCLHIIIPLYLDTYTIVSPKASFFYNIISQYLHVHHCLSDVFIHYIIVSPSITPLSVTLSLHHCLLLYQLNHWSLWSYYILHVFSFT